MIYLIESGDFYKVGYSRNANTFNKRMDSYKTHNPNFSVIELAHGSISTERAIQKGCLSLLHYGEWFKKDSLVIDLWNKNKGKTFNLNEELIKLIPIPPTFKGECIRHSEFIDEYFDDLFSDPLSVRSCIRILGIERIKEMDYNRDNILQLTKRIGCERSHNIRSGTSSLKGFKVGSLLNIIPSQISVEDKGKPCVLKSFISEYNVIGTIGGRDYRFNASDIIIS